MTGFNPGPHVAAAVVAAVSLGMNSPAFSASAATGPDRPARCAQGEAWDESMSMCMPCPGTAESALALAGEFNAFGVLSALQGPRGVDQFAAPNWFMIDAWRGIGARHLIGVELMGTAELWTYPWHGYPELLQVGEERSDGAKYIDAQHPHSSPVMGLTFSDMISFTDHRSLRLYFAPRGESTDGPVTYLHRVSARDNPDAPLGHHVGQDVGHISSTVLGAQWSTGSWLIEASAFNGTEPEPMDVSLPLGPLNSGALRLSYAASPNHRVMASVARVDQVDSTYPGTTSATRLSASIYDQFVPGGAWTVDHSFVIGSIRRHPAGATLTSFLDEVSASKGPSVLWSRVEFLQRLDSELGIASAPPTVAADDKRWVSAVTLGFTYWMPAYRHINFAIGTSVTADFVPEAWAKTYGSQVPLTARLIVQVRGSGHWRP